jgi:hypothetical protein
MKTYNKKQIVLKEIARMEAKLVNALNELRGEIDDTNGNDFYRLNELAVDIQIKSDELKSLVEFRDLYESED